MALLRVHEVSKRFGGTQALERVSVAFEAGQVHALMGENGAGKSTLVKILAGVVTPDAGEVFWDGRPVALANPRVAQTTGIGIVFQELDLFPHLTVADNLLIGNARAERPVFRPAAGDRFAAPLLAEVDLPVPPRALVADLSLGQQQRLAIARALAMQARLLILDEPTSALSEDGAQRLFALIRSLTRKGVAVIYVSHKMDEVFRLADTITVLRDGRHVSTVAAGDTTPDRVIREMVGRELESAVVAPAQPGEELLRVEGITGARLRGISLRLHSGEVLGVAGLAGSGRSSLAGTLFGLHPVRSGSMWLRNRPYAPRSPSQAIRSGVGLLPEDRKTLGLMLHLSVLENATLPMLRRWSCWGFVRRNQEREAAAGPLGEVQLKSTDPAGPVDRLSGGNQQKVLLARWLLANPGVLILDDPARGIDIGAKNDIHGIIRREAQAGKGVILISSELPELLACSDRILVMRDGRAAGILPRQEATQSRIMILATRG